MIGPAVPVPCLARQKESLYKDTSSYLLFAPTSADASLFRPSSTSTYNYLLVCGRLPSTCKHVQAGPNLGWNHGLGIVVPHCGRSRFSQRTTASSSTRRAVCQRRRNTIRISHIPVCLFKLDMARLAAINDLVLLDDKLIPSRPNISCDDRDSVIHQNKSALISRFESAFNF
jgi:hypothetical protein